MKLNSLTLLLAAALLPAAAFTSCSNDDEPASSGNNGNDGGGRFVFATTIQGSNGSTPDIVTGTSLDNDNITTVDNGLVTKSATQWIFYRNYLYGLTYAQGNSGTTRSFILGTDGEVQQRDTEYTLTSRFSSYGMYGDDIITMATGEAGTADSHGYKPMTLRLNWLNVEAETMTGNDISDSRYSMENFVGNGEYAVLAGAEQSGTKLYCGVALQGLSQYGVASDPGHWVKDPSLLNTEAGGSGSGAYKANTVSNTQYPDECWVAIYDNATMTTHTLAHTDKISTPAGRYRSQYYQSVWAVGNGDIYVFSPSYEKTMSKTLQQASNPAGVCRIPAGKTDFDDYYCDLESQTPGGNRSFMRCWPAGGNNFILIMYDRALTPGMSINDLVAIDLAIFNADTRKLTYVTGLPDNRTGFGKSTYTDGGKVYIAVNTDDGMPAIYGIDTATARATKGTVIQCTSIDGFGYLTPALR